MAGKSSDMRERIIKAAKSLVRRGGPGALTFDAVAKRLGVTKQAVIYWFPNKEALGVAVVLPALKAEARAGMAALEGASDWRDARALFAAAIARFHLGDIEQFRLMYLAPQMGARLGKARSRGAINAAVHPVTGQMYDSLEAALHRPGVPSDAIRREAVALHFSVLGIVMMEGMAQAIADPLRHEPDALVQALCDAGTIGAGPSKSVSQ